MRFRTRPPEVALGDPIIAINAGGGMPLKFDGGGHVRNLREHSNDYFVADTDTSAGSSGGGAFDADLTLVGTLARGAPDFVPTNAGCLATAREEDPRLAREQFTYAHRSVAGLCDVEPDLCLCDGSCETADDRPSEFVRIRDTGCALIGEPTSRSGENLVWAAAVIAAVLRRRLASNAVQGPLVLE